jgi:magnesium transporter
MGLSDAARIRQMIATLAIPEPMLPSTLEVPQRPRVDCLGDALLLVLHRLRFARNPLHLLRSQVEFLLVPEKLITFEEEPAGEAFPQLTHWLQQQGPSGDTCDLDDILHYLVDESLDEIFPMLEQISNRLDEFEDAVMSDPRPAHLSRAFAHRSNLRRIRSPVWPLRHQCDAITQSYATSIVHRMNQVMKTQAILTSIFAPLAFIAGIYGMNFEFMPELHWNYGYALVLLAIAIVAIMQA